MRRRLRRLWIAQGPPEVSRKCSVGMDVALVSTTTPVCYTSSMGTNYYLQLPGCDHCNRAGDRLHIGKSSGGWCFALHVGIPNGTDPHLPANLDQWDVVWR